MKNASVLMHRSMHAAEEAISLRVTELYHG
jgi:hypothetical protein